MIYKYNENRVNNLKKLMKLAKQSNVNNVIFNYGKNFKFIFKGWSFEVSHYDQEIYVRHI